jgi:ABC-type multidrug transport system ATPase subunit
VGLAQALVHDPQVLILDEPTIGLDPRQIIEIRNLIKSLGGEHTVILSTHILPEASMICNRIIIINEGRIAGEVLLKDGKVTCIEFRNPQALLFSIGAEHHVDLDCEAITEDLRREFENNKCSLSGNIDVTLKEKGSDWLIIDKDSKRTYFIRADEDKLRVYTGTMDLGESGNVYMQVRGPSEKVLARLELTQNVSGVLLEKEDDGVGTYIVTHAPGADIRAELTSLVVYSGWELLELRPAEMTLEEVFLELTREEVVPE